MADANAQSSTQAISVFASFRPKSGERSSVEKILRGMVAPTRAEPGNLVYDLYETSQTSEEEAEFHLFEQYRDAAALEAHRASDHYKAYRAAIGDYLAEPIGVRVLRVIDAKA